MKRVRDSDWTAFERAVDGKWPNVPGAKVRPSLTRVDWEALRGDYDFFTDMYAHFTPDIMRAYPEARVVIVQRDFDSWWSSYASQCINVLLRREAHIWSFASWVILGTSPVKSCRRQYLGFFGVQDLRDIDEKKARGRYDAFFKEVRELAPEGKTLDYRIGDGWEPLCEFLGKEVPDVPFPMVNTRAEHEKNGMAEVWSLLIQFFGGLVGLIAVAGAFWLMWT